MNILFILFQVGGGLVLFLFSIGMLSNTLKKVSSVRLKSILQKTTGNRVKGALTGTAVTFTVQSSSVTVLLLLGLVNAGIMNLRQAVYVILGSEIGTTITAQIVAFKVTMIFYPLMIAGFAMSTLGSKEKVKNTGDILLYLGMIFLSMKIMSDGSSPLKDYPLVLNILADFGVYPLLGILIGAVLTAITNSSSATTSLVIAMSMEGIISLDSGIALIIGANIGTCVLELIATVGMNMAARRTGMAQFMINIFGALLFYPFLEQFSELISLTAATTPRLIANAHTVFNITVSLILMPFVGVLISVLSIIIPGKEEQPASAYGILENKFLTVPALALYEAEQEVNRMASIVAELLRHAQKVFFEGDEDAVKLISETEKIVDTIYEKVSSYLNKISTVMLNEEDRAKKRALVHAVTDLERIADLAENIAGYAGQERVFFSDAAKRDLEVFFDNAVQNYTAAANSLKMKGKALDIDIHRMEHQVKELIAQYRKKYLYKLAEDEFRPVVDAFYPDVLKDIGRISDHANNISEHVLKMK
ncbi:MAG: Na/Pi cotransporter family protein [Desulfobulbaceae bacterium]|nr:Na/Pi cotransporter family protein [Desulfobulbaceae bacterium]